MRERPRNPIVPGTPKDRTGSIAIMRKALRQINGRYAGLQNEVLALFAAIPVYSINAKDKEAVRYGASMEGLNKVLLDLRELVNKWFETGEQQEPQRFWWDVLVDDAAAAGTAQSVANLTNLSTAYASTRSLDMVLRSAPYQLRMDLAKTKSYEHWTGLADDARARLSGVIVQAVADGVNPRAAQTQIMEVMKVSRSKAAQYAQTDITDTLRRARWEEADAAEEELGLRIGVLWTSALLPTTRRTHAVRNGKVYSTEEVREFYGKDGNRYNCFLPGTRVAGRFVAGSKARYKGPVITLVSAAGGEISVTSNHPVVTQRGLIPAAEVQKGDYLVADRTQVEDPVGVVHLNCDLVAPRIEDVFGALMDAGESSLVGVSGVDFHGDAAFMDEQVEVVRSERVLSFAMNAARAKLLDNLAFVKTDASALGNSSLGEFLSGSSPASCSGMGCQGVSPALVAGKAGHADELCITARSGLQSGHCEPSHDGGAIHADALADGQDRLASKVGCMQLGGNFESALSGPFIPTETVPMKELHQSAVANPNAVGDALVRLSGLAAFDEVVDVVRGEFDGHVFDLQEVSGLMLGSNFVVSNCHCGNTECLLDADGRPILTNNAKRKFLQERVDWERVQEKPKR